MLWLLNGEDPVKGEKLITEFNEIAEEKLLKTTINLPIKGSECAIACRRTISLGWRRWLGL